MTTTIGETTTTALDWAKLGTDFAKDMTNILVNKNNSSTSTQQTLPTTNYNSNQTGYAQPQKSSSNTLLYIGAGILGVALLYLLMGNNKKR